MEHVIPAGFSAAQDGTLTWSPAEVQVAITITPNCIVLSRNTLEFLRTGYGRPKGTARQRRITRQRRMQATRRLTGAAYVDWRRTLPAEDQPSILEFFMPEGR